MLRRIWTYGIVAGLIVGVPLLAMTVSMDGQPPHNGMAIGYLIMLVALSTIFLAVKRQRDRDGGGVIRFWPGFGMGLGISLVATLFYVVAWEIGLAVIDVDFIGVLTANMVEQARARGASAAEISKIVADMDGYRTMYANPLSRMLLTSVEILPVGILVSAVSAGLLRNPRFLPARRDQAATAVTR